MRKDTGQGCFPTTLTCHHTCTERGGKGKQLSPHACRAPDTDPCVVTSHGTLTRTRGRPAFLSPIIKMGTLRPIKGTHQAPRLRGQEESEPGLKTDSGPQMTVLLTPILRVWF